MVVSTAASQPEGVGSNPPWPPPSCVESAGSPRVLPTDDVGFTGDSKLHIGVAEGFCVGPATGEGWDSWDRLLPPT